MDQVKRIHFYTNLVKEGWSAKSLDSGVGGSEEKLIELARELAKDPKFEVTVYHNGEHGFFDGVYYKDHLDFKSYLPRDAFIAFKNREMWTKTVGGQKKIHWTTEIEPEFKKSELENLNQIVTISDYHKNRLPTKDKVVSDYLWIDTDRHDEHKVEKEEGTMLYASSFDRGLEELLMKWSEVKKELKLKTLYITYGWDFIDKVIAVNPSMVDWKKRMQELIKQDGIEFVGRLTFDQMSEMYWKCQYWCLPVNNPDSELFCINAIRAQYCGCIPVVRRIGALQETVNKFVDWDSLVGQKNAKSNFKEGSLEENRKHAEKFNMKDAVQRWKDRLS